jgi:hypothetical protein
MIRIVVIGLMTVFSMPVIGQEIVLDKAAPLGQVYLEAVMSESLLPMNDLGMEFGYVLYKANITAESESAVFELENVRDFAVVYVDGELRGTLSDKRKEIQLENLSGTHELQLYVENIGRITYGPEILDNSKGLFGQVLLEGEDVENWTMIPLNIRNYKIMNLTFDSRVNVQSPSFYKGTFKVDAVKNRYLDISGWGMGEVWINNTYLGSYSEQEKQQSILIQSDVLVSGDNEIVVFELKNSQQQTMKLSQSPVFH